MTLYNGLFASIIVGFILIRGTFYRWALRTRGRIIRSQAAQLTIWQIGGAVVGFVGLVLYFVVPRTLTWATIPLPAWARWLGFGIGLVGLALMLWAHLALGRNFSGTVLVREGHELVTWGPYALVRHPMYTLLYLIALSFGLLSENWLLFGYGVAYLTAVIVPRLRHEEQVLVEEFGEAYRVYQQHTRQLIPLLW